MKKRRGKPRRFFRWSCGPCAVGSTRVPRFASSAFRDRNADFLTQRFAGDAFSLLFRVQVLNGLAATPDWTAPGTVLNAWPEA